MKKQGLHYLFRMSLVLILSFVLANCGNLTEAAQSDSVAPQPTTEGGYTVSGTITGLTGVMVLDLNGAETLVVDSSSTFTFRKKLASGAAYTVSVKMHPQSPSQFCSVSAGAGTISNAHVTSVVVDCVSAYTIGVTVSGLSGSGLVLQNNGGDDLSVPVNGSFTFATGVLDGNAYAVTVLTQPSGPNQTCSVTGGSGTVSGGNVSGISISCSTNTYTIGVTVSGLLGSGLVLQNNGGDNLPISGDGSFNFATAISDGSSYAVTVLTQPSGLNQTCSVTGGVGSVSGGNVSGISVSCVTNTYTIGGNLTNLTGTIVLQNNGGDDLILTAFGGFTFATPIPDGSSYTVSVKTQPATQRCVITQGSGTVAGGPVTTVSVDCQTTGTEITVGWPYTYDKSGGADSIEDMIVDSTGNLIAVGTVTTATGEDFFLQKMAPDGTVLWKKELDSGCTGNDALRGVVLDSNNDIFVAGYKALGTCSGFTAYAGYVSKFSSADGTEDTTNWGKTVIGSASASNDELVFMDIAIDSSGNIYAVGYQRNASSTNDWVIKKYSPSGVEITAGWDKLIPGGGGTGGWDDIQAYTVAIDSTANVYVGGNVYDGVSNAEMLLKKFNATGTELWSVQQAVGGTRANRHYVTGIDFDSAGNVFVSVDMANLNGYSFGVKKFDTAGTEDTTNWNKVYSASALSYAGGYDIALSRDGNVYTAGFKQVSGYDWWLKKFDASGTEDTTNWDKVIDTLSFTGANCVAVSPIDGSVYFGGTYGTNGYDQHIRKFVQ